MKNIMTNAWTIRKAAAAKYNCTIAEISMSACLRQAWLESKQPKTVTLSLRGKYDKKAYVAQINGTDAKYGFSRDFLNKKDVTESKSNKWRDYVVKVDLVEGDLFEVCNAGEKSYYQVQSGSLVLVSLQVAKTIAA